MTQSGFDHSKLKPGEVPPYPVAFQAYILANTADVLTPNGEFVDQMLLLTFSQFQTLISAAFIYILCNHPGLLQ